MDRPRRKPKGWSLATVLVAILGFSVALPVIWLTISRAGNHSQPSLSSEIPESWTHKELADHIARNAPKYKMQATSSGALQGPAVVFVDTGVAKLRDDDRYSATEPGVVYCQLRKSAQDARDEAGTSGDEAFASGRFYFYGDPRTLAAFKASALR